MSQYLYDRRRGQISSVAIPGWAAAIGAIMAGALGIALFLASASLILMLAPVLIGVAFYARWRFRRMIRQMADQQRGRGAYTNDDIIDGDYRIIRSDDDRARR